MLDSGLAVTVHQGLAESGWSDRLKDDGEKLWVEFANVAQGDGSRDSDALVPLSVGLLIGLLVLGTRVVGFHHKNIEYLLDCI